jgi:hypothetical protein
VASPIAAKHQGRQNRACHHHRDLQHRIPP